MKGTLIKAATIAAIGSLSFAPVSNATSGEFAAVNDAAEAETETLAATDCGASRIAIAPPFGAWGETSYGPCMVFGHPGLRVVYRFNSLSDASPINLAAKVFHHETNAIVWPNFGGSTNATSPIWYWGNNASHREVRARSINVVGATVNWWSINV